MAEVNTHTTTDDTLSEHTADLFAYDSANRVTSATYRAHLSSVGQLTYETLRRPTELIYETRTDYTMDGANNFHNIARTPGQTSILPLVNHGPVTASTEISRANEYRSFGEDAARTHDNNGNLTSMKVPFASVTGKVGESSSTSQALDQKSPQETLDQAQTTASTSLTSRPKGAGWLPEYATLQQSKRILKYDAFNRLVDVNQQVTTQQGPNGDTKVMFRYAYFGNHMRAIKRVQSEKDITEYSLGTFLDSQLNRRFDVDVHQEYYYAQDQVVEESGDLGIKVYAWGNYIDELVHMKNENRSFFFHENANYSVRAVTDIHGEVVERIQYDLYGRPDFQDPDTYDSEKGRYASVSRVSSKVGNPQEFPIGE